MRDYEYDDVENTKNLVVFLLMMFPERLMN